MAATQRKLVHKQFNSPMGLYSPQNVKETLNRELQAFGGDGIEVDESVLKPSNLANSAVLKALEEEENETYGETSRKQISTRESRPRQRIIVDRDTVLKINRRGSRHRSRDHSWPPPQKERSRSGSDEIHFDEKICKQHRIDNIARKFDHSHDNHRDVSHHKSIDSLDVDMSGRINARSKTPEWPPVEREKSEGREIHAGKVYCMPDDVEHLHVGIVEPKKHFFEEIAEHVDGMPKLDKNWCSTESLYQPTKPASHFINHPQTASLDRYTSKRQLPPLKPRSRSTSASSRPRNKSPPHREMKSKSPTGHQAATIWPSSTIARHPTKSVTIQEPAKPGRSSNQFNCTPIAMSNNRDHSKTARPAKPAAPRIIDCIPKNSSQLRNAAHSNNTKQQRPSARSYVATNAEAQPIGTDSVHKTKLNQPQLAPNVKSTTSDTDPNSAACIRSIDLIDDTIRKEANPFNPPAVDEKLRSKQECIAPPLQPDNKTLTRNENKSPKDTRPKTPPNGDKYQRDYDKSQDAATADKSPSGRVSEPAKEERRKGIYYTDGEYLYGPFADAEGEMMTHVAAEAKERRQPKVRIIPIELEKSRSDEPSTANLEQKCGDIQKSIAEDLRQIDRYMMQAKMALNRLQHEHLTIRPPMLTVAPLPSLAPVVSPLQAMIKRVFRTARRTPSPATAIMDITVGIDDKPDDHTDAEHRHIENVPVVEQALQDLSHLAAVLAGDNDKDAGDVRAASNRLLSPIISTPHTASPLSTPTSVCITEIDGRSHSNLSEATTATAHSPYTVTDECETDEPHPVPNQPHRNVNDEIIQSKNVLSGYIITKKDQEELFSKAQMAKSQAETPTGLGQLAAETKPTFTQQVTSNSINPNSESSCTQSKPIMTTSSRNTETEIPPPPPPPPPPPGHVSGLYSHDVGLVTAITTENSSSSSPSQQRATTPDRPGRARNRKSDTTNKVRSLSQPPPLEYMMESVPSLQSRTTSTIDLVGGFGDDDSLHNAHDIADDGGCKDVINRRL